MNVTESGTAQFSEIAKVVSGITAKDLEKIRTIAARVMGSKRELLYFKRDEELTLRSFAVLPKKRAVVLCLKEEDIPGRKKRGGESSFRPSLFIPWEIEKPVSWCGKLTKIDPLFPEEELMVDMGLQGHGPLILATDDHNLKQVTFAELGDCDLATFNEVLSDLEILNCIESIARALQYMHGKGILHCDVKPENVLMFRGSTWSAKLTDYGHALAIEKRRPYYGTPAYFSWEQFVRIYYGNGDLFEARKECVDLWGLGIVAYKLIRGYRPHWCQYIDTLRANNFPVDDFLFFSAYYKEFTFESTVQDGPLDYLYRNLLQEDPNLRMSLTEVLDWITFQKNCLLQLPKQHALQTAE